MQETAPPLHPLYFPLFLVLSVTDCQLLDVKQDIFRSSLNNSLLLIAAAGVSPLSFLGLAGKLGSVQCLAPT